jgi:mono/diheme cytochrome c family protein
MKRSVVVAAVAGVWVSLTASMTARPAPQVPAATPAAAASPAAYRAMIDRYCVGCHNARSKTPAGDPIDLAAANVDDPASTAATWERVIRRLNLGAMPPQGSPHPGAGELDRFVTWLSGRLDAHASPRPGRFPLHRLNRAEYGNAIRDLLDVKLDFASMLPSDSASHGFDNISDVLKTSPLLLERYLNVGMRVAALAVGDTTLDAEMTTYQPRPDRSQNQHVEGLPLGTRGGIVVDHYFPVDGEYDFRPELWAAAASTVRGLEGFESPVRYEALVDGVPVKWAPIGGPADDAFSNADQGAASAAANARLHFRLPVRAGLHRVGFTFVMKTSAESQLLLQPFDQDIPEGNDGYGWPRLMRVSITGPYSPTGPGDTPARRAIFICRPTSNDAALARACARRILARLSRQAYSRPVAASELNELLKIYDDGYRERGFERGVQLALARIISGPEFLYRGDREPAALRAGAVYPVSDVALASRLSLFLWSSIPDRELLNVATAGRLRQPGVLDGQVRRMLADSRAQALVANFASQWLYLRNVPRKSPDFKTFPDFDDNLRQDLLRETDLFLDSVLLGDRSVLDLIDADYTFLTERLARHYGVPGVFGDAFRRVTLTDQNRRGLLGQGSILFETSPATRTSPVFRGKWIMTNIYNTPPLPPPPDVPALEENTGGAPPRSVRERLEQHRRNPVCASCHRAMDPLGFALENFDPVGRWRASDSGKPIDAGGTLMDGAVVDGPAALRRAIVARPNVFAGTVTERLLTYALARGLEPDDLSVVRAVVQKAAKENYRFSSIVTGIVQSVPFQMTQKPAPETGSAP